MYFLLLEGGVWKKDGGGGLNLDFLSCFVHHDRKNKAGGGGGATWETRVM